MKTEYDDNDTGVLFQNSDPKSDKSPDFLGRICIEDTWYWLSAWQKKHAEYGIYLQLSIGDPVPERGSKSKKAVAGGRNAKSLF